MDGYKRDLSTSSSEPGYRLLVEDEVPAGQGKAVIVRKRQRLRVTQTAGPQVADLNAFSLADPRERFWSGRTRILERAHLTTGNKLWSTPPYTRPMLTIVQDTVKHEPLPHGAAPHDLLFARCNREFWKILRGVDNHPNCQDNLARAIEPFGLTPDDVHDALNLFMVTGIDGDDRLFHLPPVSKAGDFVELRAEIDCIVAISSCPGGTHGQIRPLGLSIYEPI